MSDDTKLIELARRAVACTGWRWLPGMLMLSEGHNLAASRLMSRGDCIEAAELRWLPDFSDPATLGCLLALVREAWGESGCEVFSHDGPMVEALVTALEAAPC